VPTSAQWCKCAVVSGLYEPAWTVVYDAPAPYCTVVMAVGCSITGTLACLEFLPEPHMVLSLSRRRSRDIGILLDEQKYRLHTGTVIRLNKEFSFRRQQGDEGSSALMLSVMISARDSSLSTQSPSFFSSFQRSFRHGFAHCGRSCCWHM